MSWLDRIAEKLGQKQTTSYAMSPEARELWNLYQTRLGQGTPSYLTDPINRMFGARSKQARESIGEGLGVGSGLEQAQQMGITAEKGRILGNVGQQHQEMLMRQLMALLNPPKQTISQPLSWGKIAGDIGGNIMSMKGYESFMAQYGGGGVGGGGVPLPV